ncbi:MAG: hypothetical protein CMH64_04555 [Nanoarchaeota archaeon]|nr:hypothetical protein [Nanoarchaeota archaeon]|tara:strand:- start:1418 stop:1618 length:201 start_codon:yes stop_codon:yes gene_type:complete
MSLNWYDEKHIEEVLEEGRDISDEELEFLKDWQKSGMGSSGCKMVNLNTGQVYTDEQIEEILRMYD